MRSVMRCPRDGTELAKVSIIGLELDKCHKCDGIWFDRGELEKVSHAKVQDVEELLEKKYGDPTYAEGDVHAYMRCPRCGDRLLKQHYTYLNPVSVDACHKCYGFWVDDTELDAIIGEEQELEKEDHEVRHFFGHVFKKLFKREG